MSRHCCALLLMLLLLRWPAFATASDLLFYADFDHGPLSVCGTGWAVDLPTTATSFVPGRFGQAYRMERGRTNLLSPNQASAEADTSGFEPGPEVKLTATPSAARFGRQALSATVSRPGLAWRLIPVRAAVSAPHRPSKVFALSAYLRAARPLKVRLTLSDLNETTGWRNPIEKANVEAVSKDPNAKPTPVLETVATPGEAVLSATWQRVMAVLEIDGRRPEQSLVGALEVLPDESGSVPPATVLADGLQLEQTCVYPLSNTEPTSWLPGGQTRGPSWLNLEAANTGFTGETGTLALWVRPLRAECGGTCQVNAIAALGTGWFAPLWHVSTNAFYAGEAYKSGFKIGVFHTNLERQLQEEGPFAGWHHLALAWDAQGMAGYLDGKPVGHSTIAPGAPVPGSLIRLGGSFLESTAMTGDLDEVALFRRCLGEPEIAALATATQPLAGKVPATLLRHPPRTVFLRSEAVATIPLVPVPFHRTAAPVAVSARVPALQATVTGRPTVAKPLALTLKPWLAAAGRYPLEIRVGEAALTDQLRVFDEPQGRDFIIYSWGTDKDLKDRGFNASVGGGAGFLQTQLEQGMFAYTRIDVRDGVPHPWSPASRAKAPALAAAVAREGMAWPHVVACLVNSEVGDPPFPQDQPWFEAWLRQETGLAGIPAGIVRDPLHAAPDAARPVPPVLPEDNPQLTFLRWWRERGQGYWLLNNLLAEEMRRTGLHCQYYSDQPVAVTQFAKMDMVDHWAYPRSPQGLIARFNQASGMARLVGKSFQAMPGTCYWDDGNGLWVTDSDGKRKVLCLSPDCFRENLWIAVACPSHSVGLYGLGERHTGVYDPICDQVMTDTYALLQPVGTLVGGLPTEQARVALLETDGLYFTQPGVYDNWVRHWTMRTASRALAQHRVAYDWITDDHVKAGWLSRYDAVVVPGAWTLPQKTYEGLRQAARAGTRIVADKIMRAELPNLTRLDLDQQRNLDSAAAVYGAWADAYRPTAPTFARVTPADKVFVFVREAPGPATTRGRTAARVPRYLFLINDHREPGPQYERWQTELSPVDGPGPLRDRGLPQEVTVTVPSGYALYNVLTHEPFKATVQGQEASFSVRLDPGAAAVIACLPTALARLEVSVPAALQAGTATELTLQVLDAAGRPLAGRQLVELALTGPGQTSPWPGLQRYLRLTDGQRKVALRLPLSMPRGAWQLSARDWLSGKTVVRTLQVK